MTLHWKHNNILTLYTKEVKPKQGNKSHCMCVHVHICNFVRLLLLLILSCLLWRFNPLCFIVAHVLLLWQKKKYLTILLKQNHQSYVRTIPVHFPLLMITLKWSYIVQSWKNRRQQIFCCLFPQALFHTRHTLCFFCMLTIHTKNMYSMYVYYVYIILRIFCCLTINTEENLY